MFLILALASCAGGGKPAVKGQKRPLPSLVTGKKATLPLDEQKRLAFDVFNEILTVSQGEDRFANLDRMTSLYLKIVNEYPDAPLAQESFLRLVSMFLRDYDPPREDEALALYEYFLKRYPGSPLKNAVENTVSRYYYGTSQWKKLKDFVSPHIRRFVETGDLKTPVHLFFFTEAKFHLGDYREAYKGYRIIQKRFPGSSDARVAASRLAVIREMVRKKREKR